MRLELAVQVAVVENGSSGRHGSCSEGGDSSALGRIVGARGRLRNAVERRIGREAAADGILDARLLAIIQQVRGMSHSQKN